MRSGMPSYRRNPKSYGMRRKRGCPKVQHSAVLKKKPRYFRFSFELLVDFNEF
jgi:hypothetical protein